MFTHIFKNRFLNKAVSEFSSTENFTLKKKAFLGTAWTTAGYGATQLLRLGGNLILTRILFPEAFGLMAIVHVWMIGLQMFSDIGVVPAIIQNKGGDDPDFLNTAWTIQIIRGSCLWICSILLAGPVALMYEEPLLKALLPVVGVNSLINGFNSTKLATANRRLLLERLTLIDVGSYTFGLICMIIWAWITRSVWALVWGGIISSILKMAASHLLIKGKINRLHWNNKAFRDLRKFGSWIFVSTIVTFLTRQGDRFFIGYLVDVRFLAFYFLAVNMNQLFFNFLKQIGAKVLFPVYSTVMRERPKAFYFIIRKSRLIQLILSWLVSLFFILFGKELMGFLYDERYVESGWILQVLALGQLVHVLESSYVGVLMSMGNTKIMTMLLFILSSMQTFSIFLGHYLLGAKGIVYGLVFTRLAFYPVNAFVFGKLSLWQPELDIPFLVLFVLILFFFLI
jgi:O-antigen/teichoic acid export membrane protein